MFRPKLLDTLKQYTRRQFGKDFMAGIIVGIVAIPLAIAFAIASGVSPEKGLFTAIIGGFIISLLGGSRVQIGGPTGAFIVIVYGIVQQYGVNGLIIATFIAGVMLIIMGLARLGSVIKFIPHPLITGFTSGIALIIFSSQVKDLLGLQTGALPADFIDKWALYFRHAATLQWQALAIGTATIAIIIVWPKITGKIPGSLAAIIITTLAVEWLHLPVETIGSRFGTIPSILPKPLLPQLDFATIKNMVQPAFTIALLGGIESLLSAVVADGMIGGSHRSNMELVAQGTANMASALFGGIPATGAIARTATNVKNGGRTPVAGMVHALTLFAIMAFAGKWAAYIPMATLAGILVVVAYNMSEWENFVSVLKGPGSDIAILLTTFLLTVLVDLTVAIEIGMVLAAFLFMRTMIKSSEIGESDLSAHAVPKGVEVFEVSGPLFFGAAYKIREALQYADTHPKILILRMGRVPMIDATGLRVLKEVQQRLQHHGTKIILSEIKSEQALKGLRETRLLFAIGKANVTTSFEQALKRSAMVLKDWPLYKKQS